MDRLGLQTKLEKILGTRNVYFQPPESIKINYPAIIYSLDKINADHADNLKYKKYKQYTVTLIDKDPESEYADALFELPYSSFKTFYTKDNLNHFIFTLYY